MLDAIISTLWTIARLIAYTLTLTTTLLLLKALYNISPFHPLAKHPGPVLWRASRLFASYHHIRGDLYKQIAAIHTKYGPTVRLAPDELSFTAPEAWGQIYNSRPQLQKSQFHFANNEADGRLPESMITATDQEHMRLRRLAGPAFLNSGVQEVEPVLQQYTDELCAQLTKVSATSSGSSQNMVEWLLWTLSDVIGKLAMDHEFQSLEQQRMHPWPSFLMAALKQIAIVNQFLRFGLRPKWLDALVPKMVADARDNFLNMSVQATKERLAHEDREGGGEKKRDIVGLMLREMKGGERLSEGEITANSLLIVGAGAETTSTLLSAALYHLCRTPRVMGELRKEIRSTFPLAEDITVRATAALPYLKAVIDESLRIFPVASYVTPRMTPMGGHVVGGEMVPGSTYVSMGQWFMGRSSEFFDNPMDYRPERWLNEDGSEAHHRKGGEDIMRPFSLGPRNCIGKLLALAEARLVLAKLLWHFDMELDGPHEKWVEDARFYILWQLQPLNIKLSPVER